MSRMTLRFQTLENGKEVESFTTKEITARRSGLGARSQYHEFNSRSVEHKRPVRHVFLQGFDGKV